MPRPTPLPALLLLSALVAVAGAPPARGDGEAEVRRTRVVTAVERARPAVVAIHTTEIVKGGRFEFMFREYEVPDTSRKGLGSGVIFHPDGYVVTNAHVIARADQILVDLARKDPAGGPEEIVQLGAVILAVDVDNDLALLKLEGNGTIAAPFPFLPLGRSNDLMLGESVIAVGHPWGLGFTVTTGVLGGMGRHLPGDNDESAAGGPGGRRARAAPDDPEDTRDFLQIDAAINQGNSGGPLMDVTGRWIGVTSAILNRQRTGAEGIGFAIPADRVRSLILRAMKRRLLTEEWIGIEEDHGSAGEAVVEWIFPKGPAAQANLRKGDAIIALNGKPVRDLYEYRMQMAALPPRSRVTLSIARGGTVLPAPVVLTLEPVPTARLSDRHLGLQAVSIDETINRQTSIPFDSGVLVREVRPQGPADRIHLKPGDLVMGLGRKKIGNADDLLIFLQYVQPGDLVSVKVRRFLRRFSNGGLQWEDKEGLLVAE